MTKSLLEKIKKEKTVVAGKYEYALEGVYIARRDVKSKETIESKSLREYALEIENRQLKKEIKDLKQKIEEYEQARASAGRKKLISDDDIKQIKIELELGIPLAKIARERNVSRNTIYAALKQSACQEKS